MIEFVPVSRERFPTVYGKMIAAFPLEERRNMFDQEECFKNPCFKFFEIYDGTDVGFISLWVFGEFVFIEHLAIDENIRSKGYGSQAIELVKDTFNLPIVLEAEAPVTPQQIKRINFYSRLGFKVNDYGYYQPSYHGEEPVPLKLLSFPQLLTGEEYDLFIKRTREHPYKKHI